MSRKDQKFKRFFRQTLGDLQKKKKKNITVVQQMHDRNVYQILPVGDKSIEITEKKVNKLVYGFAKENKITTPVYHELKCDKAVTPKFNGLPKIHKSDVPLRPIVSFIGAPTYCLAKFLVGILSPLLSLEYTVQNSSQFVRLINNFQCLSDECLVSFDVVSLFTSISVPETLSIISNLLMSDNLLHERTNLTASDVIKCVELCLYSTVFSFNDSLYRQIFGAPMGSCISPVVANIFMKHLERQALTSFREPPRIWLRYVDDVFCVIKSSVIDDFHHHIDSISPNVKFTLELEDNNSLAFLDVYVKRTVNSKLWTTIYQKPTHTGRYLQFDSHHPLHHKSAVARTLHHRIDSHIQKPSERKSHFDLTKKTLTLNGFPARFTHPFSESKTDKPASTQLTFSGFTTLPYIKGVSDKIKRILLETGVQVAFKLFLTIGRFLPSLKDEINHNEKSNLIYEVPCQNCPFVYIGQTKRDLKSRIKEHQRAIKYQRPEKSALCQHSMENDHLIDWSKVKILKVEHDYSKRLFIKSWYINEKPQVLNRNDGLSFPAVYRKLLNSQC